MIKKFDYATPGRNGNYEQLMMLHQNLLAQQVLEQAQQAHKLSTLSTFLVDANIVDVDACMTRLRVTVKDAEKVGTEEQWKAEGAMGLVMKGQGVQSYLWS